MKIAVFGLGYVGLSNAVLLAQHNEVTAVDIMQERIDMLNARQSPVIDAELEEFLTTRSLNLTATTDAQTGLKGADYAIVATPTNYDIDTNKFDTSSVEAVMARVELGYAPARDFSQGFAETLAWFLAREDWWQPLVKRAVLDR